MVVLMCVCVYGLYELVTEVWNGLEMIDPMLYDAIIFLCSLGLNKYSVQSLCETLGQTNILFIFCDHCL